MAHGVYFNLRVIGFVVQAQIHDTRHKAIDGPIESWKPFHSIVTGRSNPWLSEDQMLKQVHNIQTLIGRGGCCGKSRRSGNNGADKRDPKCRAFQSSDKA